MVKPEFFDDPDVAGLSPMARLFFIGLWMQADRAGRLVDDARRLKARIFPYDDIDPETLAAELAHHDMIRRYHDDAGHAFIWIRSFEKHQRPHPKEPQSVLPPWRSDAVKRNGKPWKKTEGCTESGSLVNGSLVNGTPTRPLAAVTVGPDELMAAWNRLTNPPIIRAKELTGPRRRHSQARLRDRPLTEWEAVFARIEASRFCRGENDRQWRASFDWAIGSPDVAVKVLEGKYDGHEPIEGRREFYTPWECPHAKTCTTPSMCEKATALGRPRKPDHA